MSSFLLQNFNGGESEFENRGIKGAYKHGQALDIRKKVDSLSCQQALAEEGSGVIVDLIMFIVPCSDGNAYGFGDTGKIYKRTSAGTWSVVYTDSNGEIKGASEWFLSSTLTYLFWATNTRLNCKEIPGNSGWTDVNALATYPKTNLTAADWHTMTQAVGALHIANKDYLALVGFDGSYSNASLNIFKKNEAKALIERGNYVVVGAPRTDESPESNLLSWDATSQDYNDKKIVTEAVNALVDTDLPLAQAGTNGGLYYADLVNIMPIQNIDGGGSCNPGGVTTDSGVALFGIFGNTLSYNGIWSYGRNKKNQAHTLNYEYVLTCDEIGAVSKVGSTVLMSYKNGASYGVKKVDSTAKATAYYYSLDLVPPKAPNYMPEWGPVVFTMKALPASCQVEVFYRMDKTGSFVQAKMEGNTSAFTTTNGKEAIFLTGEKGKIAELEIKLTPSANTTPEIYTAEWYFS